MYKGQQIIAINNCPMNRFKKDQIETVLDVFNCSCGRKMIDFGDKLPLTHLTTKCACGEISNKPHVWWSYAESWRPVVSTYQKITFSKIIETTEACSN